MYTSHGHHIPGTTAVGVEEKPLVARCGGPGVCTLCSIEAARVAVDIKSKVSSIMKYFAYEHLPLKLQLISKSFCELADKMDATLPDGAEKSVTLRKLLEAKDAAVRSALDLDT